MSAQSLTSGGSSPHMVIKILRIVPLQGLHNLQLPAEVHLIRSAKSCALSLLQGLHNLQLPAEVHLVDNAWIAPLFTPQPLTHLSSNRISSGLRQIL
jgi:hypothetical protein